MSDLKTMTLGKGDDPSHVICPGHVRAEAFNKAFRAEGWQGDENPFVESDLERRWMRKHPNGSLSFCNEKLTSDYEAVTVARWD